MPKLGIKLINGSPYSPTTQGQVERFNRTLKSLLRKEIQIELSNNNFTLVENWAIKLIPRVIDSYIHKIHRSLSRTPWELYKNRTSPHPVKTSIQMEPVTSVEIESCCTFPNLESGFDYYNYDLKMSIRHNSEVRDKLNVCTLNQTRKVQMENYRKLTKTKVGQNFELGTIAYMRNPLVSKLRTKKTNETT